MRGTRSTGAIARYATHARNFGIAKNPEFDLASAEIGAKVFAAFVLGAPIMFVVGCIVFLTWLQ